MNIKTITNQIKCLTCVAGVVFSGAVQAADITDSEINGGMGSNDSPASAQNVVIGLSPVNVYGVVGSLSFPVKDVDFYKIYGNEGDVVTIDVENGIGGQKSVNTTIALLDSAKVVLIDNDDDGSTQDSKIDSFRLPATGNYYIGVTSSPLVFVQGGSTTGMFNPFGSNVNGDYNLVISKMGATTSEKVNKFASVNIDIKPGVKNRAPLNEGSNGVIPVALLSNDDFDPMADADLDSLTFGHSGDESTLHKCHKKGRDMNGDGVKDVVCTFSTRNAGFMTNDLEGVLKGNLKDGGSFEGRGTLKVLGKDQ